MRTTKFLLATVKETPADAEIISHKLMLRAGMMRKNAAGIYSWLPLGYRVLKKVTAVVRAEMDKSGALEINMPAIQPAELWQESGRWNMYGEQLLKLRDRHKHDFCFGPTHEEVITDLMRNELRSYKQLPITLYQIQTKFRDEIRPRFGVMRAREFLMKDAYSFHLDHPSLQETYDLMHQTYSNIFTRLGLKFRAVLADTGNIGGNSSHEFHVLAASGEDVIAFSDASDYAANLEKAEALAPTVMKEITASITMPTKTAATTTTAAHASIAAAIPLQLVATPQQKTIAEICAFLKVEPQYTLKTLIVKGKNTPLIALVLRGDHELNEIKAGKLANVAEPLQLANDKEVEEILGCPVGFIGPINLAIPIIIDRDAAAMAYAHACVCGANKVDAHYINFNWQRDVVGNTVNAAGVATTNADRSIEITDIRKVIEGDSSPDGKGTLHFARGIEVGHIFQLGTKYSAAMGATVLNTEGKATPMVMGCYGIGVSRIVAAAIEQNHDERGIIWPEPIAPFHIALIPISMQQSYRVREVAEKLYQELEEAGFEVLLDDRKERAGVIFADMDLIGIPHRIVISEGNLDKGVIEYKARSATATAEYIALEKIVAFCREKIGALL